MIGSLDLTPVVLLMVLPMNPVAFTKWLFFYLKRLLGLPQPQKSFCQQSAINFVYNRATTMSLSKHPVVFFDHFFTKISGYLNVCKTTKKASDSFPIVGGDSGASCSMSQTNQKLGRSLLAVVPNWCVHLGVMFPSLPIRAKAIKTLWHHFMLM